MKIQNAPTLVELCYRAAGLLTLTAEAKMYQVLETDDIGERMKLTVELLKNEMEFFKQNQAPKRKQSGFSMF